MEVDRVHGPTPQGLQGCVYSGWYRRHPTESGRQQHQCRHHRQLPSRRPDQVKGRGVAQESGTVRQNSGEQNHLIFHKA